MKLAILSTSEILRYENEPDARAIMGTWAKHGRTGTLYTTGILEKSLSEGYTVLIVSSRTFLDESDQWWKDLVELDNIYLANDHPGEITNDDLNLPWKRVCRRFGIEDQFNWTGWHWHELRKRIIRRLEAKTGSDF
jgi:hypothetical protein